MSWSYSLSSLSTSPKDQVRLAIGDTDAADQKVQDEEIDFYLSLSASIFSAAAKCCRTLATQMSGNTIANVASYRAGDTEIKNNSSASKNAKSPYLQLAQEFELLARSDAATGSVMPYMGGVSHADKELYEGNDDLVKPSFAVGMFDSDSIEIISHN